MNMDDFINEIEGEDSIDNEKLNDLFKRHYSRLIDVRESETFKNNTMLIVNETYRTLKAMCNFFMANEIKDKHKVSIEKASEMLGLNIEELKIGEDIISKIVYPLLLEFCTDVLKIKKD